MYETEGRDDDVYIHLPEKAKSVLQVNHIEEPLQTQEKVEAAGKGFRFRIGHNQIRSFLITF